MSITTLNFFVFVAVVMAVYYLCMPKKFRWCVLLIASYVFYGFADYRLFIFLIIATLSVYFGALWIEAINKPAPDGNSSSRNSRILSMLIIAVIVIGNFAILATFKWWNTFANVSNNLLTARTDYGFRFPVYSLILPLGISFYTFQAVGYLIDVYRDTIKAERNIARFALFISFFPQLIQGPISRHSELAQQLYAPRSFNHIGVLHGFQLMLWGLFKKLVVADRMILIVSAVFADTTDYSGFFVFFSLAIHVIWLYMDFSGGVDIARGVGQMFGIIMPQNFIRPFFSGTLPEYWRRWHATLNNWWRDYLFYPLLRCRCMTGFCGFVRKHISKGLGKVIGIYIAINVVRIINAMWHGANAFFVVEGLYFGILIVLGMMFTPVFKKITSMFNINTTGFAWKLFQTLRTFALICFSRAFMATESVSAGISSLMKILRDFFPLTFRRDIIYSTGLDSFDILIIIGSLILVFIIEVIQESGISIRQTLSKSKTAVQWLVLMIALWTIILFGQYGINHDPSAFLYMGF